LIDYAGKRASWQFPLKKWAFAETRGTGDGLRLMACAVFIPASFPFVRNR
jgi:hypothetical protein